MTHFPKIATGIDVAPLLSEIAAQPELWDTNPARKNAPNSPHSRMSDIWIRYNGLDRMGPRWNDEHVPVWYPAWHRLPALKPLVFGLMSSVRGEMIGGVLITRIPPGEGLDPHIDRGWHVDYYDKFYLSLRSGPGADFICEADGAEERIAPDPGDLILFDNRKKHWVENRSDQDRVTLIMCIRTAMFGRL